MFLIIIDVLKVILRLSLEVRRGDEIVFDVIIFGLFYLIIIWIKDEEIIILEEIKKRVVFMVRRRRGEV